MRNKRNVYKLVAGKLRGRRPLGRSRNRWVWNIKLYLNEKKVMVWSGSYWVLVNTAMNLRIP
jgi:hypothetical protein